MKYFRDHPSNASYTYYTTSALHSDLKIQEMTTPTEKIILVPVRVDAFIFNSQSYFPIQQANGQLSDPVQEAENRAILAPIMPPDYRNLRLESEFIRHDIFGSIDIRDVDLSGSYLAPRLWSSYPPVLTRKLESTTREGMYLHWSLPKMYRQGMSTTPSAQAVHRKEVLRHGYQDAAAATAVNSGDGLPSSRPVFRSVPDRWIVVRVVENGEFSRQTLSSDRQLTRTPINPPSGGGSKVFVIESNRVRHIEEISPDDDLLTSTSAYIDPSKPLDQQGEIFLGCSWSLQDWIKSATPDPSSYIPLTVVTTGNPFFADYQQHNTGVFSFYDDLTAKPGDAEYQENAITMIDSGKISYTIMGFHSTPSSDPLVIDPKTTPQPVPSHQDRLKMCSMEMNHEISPDDWTWLAKSDGAQMRVLCHGSALSIDWNVDDSKHSPSSPADTAQRVMCKSHPIAVGTNSIDALLGWMRVSMGSGTFPGSDLHFSDIAQSLLKIQTLVQNTEDTVDSQLEAADMLATNNFIRNTGGTAWHLKKHSNSTSSQSQKPDELTLSKLREINLWQRMLDACLMETAQLKIELFEEFWKYAVDRDPTTDHDKMQVMEKVNTILTCLGTSTPTTLGTQILDKRQRIQDQIAQIDCEPGVMPPFIMQQDPTVLFAGIPSGREKASGNPLLVRLDGQETKGLDDPSKDARLRDWAQIIDNINNNGGLKGKVSSDLITALTSLLEEAAWLTENKQGSVPSDSSIKGGCWDGKQAWYPLFVEWTVEYYHIPFIDWDFNFEGPEGESRYRIKPGTILSNDPTIQGDFRILSGRSPILQQTSNSIQTLLKQLFSRVNPDDLDLILSPKEREELLADVANLTYFSATMDGFTDQLLTRKRGTHLQPNNVSDQGSREALDEAQKVGGDIGLGTDETIAQMDFTTPYTPFASLTPIPADPTKYSPFKPCTHGQFRFTKLLVVDKFGQVITPINVFKPSIQNPIYPCPSDPYSLNALADGTANAILRSTDPKMSEFMQLPPSLNQPARLNTDYVMYDDRQKGWRATDEWENPVCGWIVVNFPDYSIQVFDQEGHFIREFQVMNASAAVSFPFEPPKTLPGNVNKTLSQLMAQLSKTSFLEGLFDTLCAAGESVKHPPNSYAESMMGVLGRPLAIVQMGFSLELANAPLRNQSTIATLEPKPDITSYNISMKLGDKDNTLDGLAGYFKLDRHDPTEFDLSSFFSYFAASTKTGDPSNPITDPFSLTPYYLDPADAYYNANETSFANTHDAQREVIAAIVDPFVAVHAYTELLPTKLLSLPPWVISNGIKRVSTFFRMGPLLVSRDVPGFVPGKAVNHDYQLDEKNAPDTTGGIPVPVAVRKEEWVWLQPYWQQDDGETEYNFLDVEEEGQMRPWDGKDSVPCTAVEGYLQMRRPFGVDDRSQNV